MELWRAKRDACRKAPGVSLHARSGFALEGRRTRKGVCVRACVRAGRGTGGGTGGSDVDGS